jgi:5-methylthioribose kinase
MSEVHRINNLRKKEWEALSEFVTTLGDDEKLKICAIMLLGRGDFKTYEESLKHCETHSFDTASEYILGKTLKLEEYLRKGIAKL